MVELYHLSTNRLEQSVNNMNIIRHDLFDKRVFKSLFLSGFVVSKNKEAHRKEKDVWDR